MAPVGLAVTFDEPRFGNDQHLRDVFAAARTLYKLHIPFAAVPLENLTSHGLARHKIILAPQVQHLSVAQLSALNQFVEKGGRLLATGVCGEYDESGLPRKGTALTGLHLIEERQPPPNLRPDQGAAIHLSSLQEIVPRHEFAVVDALEIRKPDAFAARRRELALSENDSTSYARFNQWLTALGGGELSLAMAAPAVGTVAYERLVGANGWLTVHAIRYSVPTWGGDDADVKPFSLSLEIPLPAGWALEQAIALSPDKSPVPLEAQVALGKVRCELPPFEFYSLVSLKLQQGDAPTATAKPKPTVK